MEIVLKNYQLGKEQRDLHNNQARKGGIVSKQGQLQPYISISNRKMVCYKNR